MPDAGVEPEMLPFLTLVVGALILFGQGTSSCEAEEVPIGYFGPASSAHPEGGDLWCAASMALDEANEAGGYQGRPFRLVTSWSENPWGSGVADVARMAYIEKVWAMVGGIDGSSTHLAEQVVAKARLVLINPVATDTSINMASVPWMFSCVPLDDVQTKVLAQAIAADVGEQPFVVVSGVNHDAHLFAVELLKALKECNLAPTFHFECDPGKQDSHDMLERMLRIDPKAIVLIADARGSARLLTKLRREGYEGHVFGGPWMGRRAFVEQAGAAAEAVLFSYSLMTSSKSRAFAKRFAQRFGRDPDYAAAHTYDAVCLLVAAIRQGGLDRTRIRDAVREMSPWSGVTGEIRWNTVGANGRSVHIGTIREGKVRSVPSLSQALCH